MQVPAEARKGSQIPENGVTGGCQLPAMGAGSRISVRTARLLATSHLQAPEDSVFNGYTVAPGVYHILSVLSGMCVSKCMSGLVAASTLKLDVLHFCFFSLFNTSKYFKRMSG